MFYEPYNLNNFNRLEEKSLIVNSLIINILVISEYPSYLKAVMLVFLNFLFIYDVIKYQYKKDLYKIEI